MQNEKPRMSMGERLKRRLAEDAAAREASSANNSGQGRESRPTSYEQWKAKRDRDAQQREQPKVRGARTGGRVYTPSSQREDASPEPVRPPSQEVKFVPARTSEPTAPRSVEERRPSQENTEGQRRLLQEQIRGIDGSIYQARQAVERLRRDGLAWEADGKEALIEALKSSRKRLEQQLSEIPAET
jgi:hypothetical protein